LNCDKLKPARIRRQFSFGGSQASPRLHEDVNVGILVVVPSGVGAVEDYFFQPAAQQFFRRGARSVKKVQIRSSAPGERVQVGFGFIGGLGRLQKI
jgi:hypothetical protein